MQHDRSHLPSTSRRDATFSRGSAQGQTREQRRVIRRQCAQLLPVLPSEPDLPPVPEALDQQQMVPVRFMKIKLQRLVELRYFLLYSVIAGLLLLSEHLNANVSDGHDICEAGSEPA